MLRDREVPIDLLMKKMQITKRTFYYDVQKINDFFKERNIDGLVEISQKKVICNVTDYQEINKQIEKINNYLPSSEERKCLEMLCIALNPEKVTLEVVKNLVDVSRNTALTDIKTISSDLQSEGLDLITSVKKGYEIVGDEASIRRYLLSKVEKYATGATASRVKRTLQEILQGLIGNEIDYFWLATCIIRQYEIDSGGYYAASDINMESLKIEISLIRSMLGKQVFMSDEETLTLMDTVAFRSIEISAKKLKLQNIVVPQNEICYLTTIVLGKQLMHFSTVEQEEAYIADLCSIIISNFERIGCLYFPEKDHLKKQLERHVRPLYFRMKYGIIAENLILDEIRSLYPIIYDFTRRSLSEPNLKFPLLLSAAEIGHICIYMASNLREDQITKRSHFTAIERDILIICLGDITYAIRLQQEMEAILGDGFRYTVVGENALQNVHFEEYVMVISVNAPRNIAALDNAGNIVHIKSTISKNNIKEIVKILSSNKIFKNVTSQVDDIMRIVSNNARSVERDNLYLSLFRYVNESQNEDSIAENLDFSKYSAKEKLIVVDSDCTWQDAISVGSNALSDGSDNLSERMQNLIKRKRVQYYRLSEDVIVTNFPMQGDEGGSVDYRIIFTKNGMECMDGERASFMICVSTVDNYSHWELLHELYNVFENKKNILEISEMY